MTEVRWKPMAKVGLSVPWRRVLAFARRKPLGATSLLLLAALVYAAVLPQTLAPYDPLQVFPGHQFAPPDNRFPFGTDAVARDLFSRVVWGARLSLTVGFLSVLLGTTTGAMLGIVGAYVGGLFDIIVQRIVDIVIGFPALILALSIVAISGPSLTNVLISVSFVLWPQATRVLRSAALSIKENMYIEAAHAIGCSPLRIILRHVLPQCVAPYIILATASMAWAIIVEASLSFLGMGIPPPDPSWGQMLGEEARFYVEVAPWLGIFPGVALSIAVFAISILGDALRDELDPRLKH